MSTVTAAMPSRLATKPIAGAGMFALGALALAAAGLCVRLWPEWRHNPDLSHGMFMPIVFVVLLHEARSSTRRYLDPHGSSRFGFVALLVGGLLALVAAGLYAAAVDWSHALVNLMLALSLVLFL